MRIIHFAFDEKFIPFTQTTFEAAFPGSNEYRLPGDPTQPLEHVQAADNVRVEGPTYWRSDRVTGELERFDCLVVHSMGTDFMEGVKRAPEDMLVVWAGWGADYYHLIEPFHGPLLLDKTRALVDAIHSRTGPLARAAALRSRLRRVVQAVLRRRRPAAVQAPPPSIHDIIDKIDVLCVNPEEIAMIQRALPGFRGRYHMIHPYSAESVLSSGPERMAGPDILLGNSATATNNHVELLEALAHLDLEGRRLIAPLSYGDRRYGDAIARLGRRLFGDRFVALRRYLPLPDYHEVLSTCGVVLMNHVRQQAGATIATALYKGATVYVRRENPIRAYYSKMGARLFTIQDGLLDGTGRLRTVSEADRAVHRTILREYWSFDAAVSRARSLRDFAEARTRRE